VLACRRLVLRLYRLLMCNSPSHRVARAVNENEAARVAGARAIELRRQRQAVGGGRDERPREAASCALRRRQLTPPISTRDGGVLLRRGNRRAGTRGSAGVAAADARADDRGGVRSALRRRAVVFELDRFLRNRGFSLYSLAPPRYAAYGRLPWTDAVYSML
jgi:hypothetical protein